MSIYEPMDTDHRQTLLGLNQDKELERLISDVMNHKVSPNALAESRELVQLGYALECFKDTLRSTSRTQSFGCGSWITLRSSRISYVARDLECWMDSWMPSPHYWIFSQRQVIFTMPSLLASMSRKCASFRQLIPGFTRSLSKDITLCEGVRYYGRDSGQTLWSSKFWWGLWKAMVVLQEAEEWPKLCGISGCTACTLVLQFMMQWHH